MTTQNLWVDNEDSGGTWGTTGTPPYLGIQDQPTNFISSTSRNANSGVYSFQAGAGAGTINSVTLYIYAYGVASSDFTSILSTTDTSLGPPASWGWVNTDVSAILDSWAAINAAVIYFDRPNTQNDAGVDACYLLVDYTSGTTIDETDDVAIGESAAVEPLLRQVGKADSITLADTPTARLIPLVSETDDITLTDTPTARLIPLVSETDGVTIGESTTITPLLRKISKADGLTLGESITAALDDLILSETDGITLGDTVVDIDVVGGGGPDINIAIAMDDMAYWRQGVKVQ